MQTSDGSTLEPYNFIEDKNIARSVTARLRLLLESRTRLQLLPILFGFKKEEDRNVFEVNRSFILAGIWKEQKFQYVESSLITRTTLAVHYI